MFINSSAVNLVPSVGDNLMSPVSDHDFEDLHEAKAIQDVSAFKQICIETSLCIYAYVLVCVHALSWFACCVYVYVCMCSCMYPLQITKRNKKNDPLYRAGVVLFFNLYLCVAVHQQLQNASLNILRLPWARRGLWVPWGPSNGASCSSKAELRWGSCGVGWWLLVPSVNHYKTIDQP